MEPLPLLTDVTDANFTEADYLFSNQDVAAAVKSGQFASGRDHFDKFGHRESRRYRKSPEELTEIKRIKLKRIKAILRKDMDCVESDLMFDFLTPELRNRFDIVDTSNVSDGIYRDDSIKVIQKYSDGLVLDCGAGQRSEYYENVVNFEIVDFDSTDVRGVGERLPFQDDSFDAVLSHAVLEHVKFPWICAQEIARVLKPGGELVCSVPFLQPVHGYPNHFYNMTSQGLQNLFEGLLDIEEADVPQHLFPIWSLTWMINSWAADLPPETREEFLSMRLQDLTSWPTEYLDSPFVKELSEEANFTLASGSRITARKPL